MFLVDLFWHAAETLACFSKRNAHIHNDAGYTAIAVIKRVDNDKPEMCKSCGEQRIDIFWLLKPA